AVFCFRRCQMKREIFGVFTTILLFSALVAQAGDAKKELEKFEGTWKVTKLEAEGEQLPPAAREKLEFVFKGDKVVIKGGKKDEEGEVKLNPSKKPAEITFVPKTGADAGKNQVGIYKFEGKSLVFCIAVKLDGERPSDFKSGKGSGAMTIVLEKAK